MRCADGGATGEEDRCSLSAVQTLTVGLRSLVSLRLPPMISILPLELMDVLSL